MTKKMLAFVPGAIVAGTVLLTACSQGGGNIAQPAAGGSAAGGSATTSVITQSQPGAGNGAQALAGKHAGTMQGVNCGSLTLPNGQPSSLIADPTDTGVVGCTEAFNVLDEYLNSPGRGDGSRNYKALSNGWACSTDGGSGSIASRIFCSNGKDDGHGGKQGGVGFHTEPA